MQEPVQFLVSDANVPFPATGHRYRASAFVDWPTDATFEIAVGSADRDPISQAVRSQAYAPPPSFRVMFTLMTPGCTVLDLGANIGTFSLAAASLGCRVISVEASPHNVALLEASVLRNRFTQMQVVHAAISDHIGELEFSENGPWGFIVNSVIARPGITVQALTVDALLAQLGCEHVDLVKMDIEGSEVAAVRGMSGLLSGSKSPPVFYESNGHTLRLFNETPDTLRTSIQRFGYQSYIVEPGRLVPIGPTDLQAECFVDYLAVKQMPVGLRQFRRETALSREEIVLKILGESVNPNPDQRANLCRALAAKRDSLSDERVLNAMLSLLDDPDPEVRAAAEWIRQLRPARTRGAFARVFHDLLSLLSSGPSGSKRP